MVDERFPPSFGIIRRRRRRGPRLLHALERRSRPLYQESKRQPPGGSPGVSGLEPLAFDMKVTITYLNIRGFASHQVELEAYLRIHQFPSIVGITGPFLDASTKNICLSWYVLVSR